MILPQHIMDALAHRRDQARAHHSETCAMRARLDLKLRELSNPAMSDDPVARAQWDRWALAKQAHLRAELQAQGAACARSRVQLIAAEKKLTAARRLAAAEQAKIALKQKRKAMWQPPVQRDDQ